MRAGIGFPLSVIAMVLLLAACGPEQRPSPAGKAMPGRVAAGIPPVAPPLPQVPTDAEVTTTYLYQCGDREVTASFHGEGDADISFNGQVLNLPRQPVGTGARYADAAGNLFWVVSEGEALLSVQGQADRRCTRPPPAFR